MSLVTRSASRWWRSEWSSTKRSTRRSSCIVSATLGRQRFQRSGPNLAASSVVPRKPITVVGLIAGLAITILYDWISSYTSIAKFPTLTQPAHPLPLAFRMGLMNQLNHLPYFSRAPPHFWHAPCSAVGVGHVELPTQRRKTGWPEWAGHPQSPREPADKD
jgi:hypothetical protein